MCLPVGRCQRLHGERPGPLFQLAGQCLGQAVIVDGALHEARHAAFDIRDRGRNVIVEIAAQIVELVVAACLRCKG